MKPYSSRDVTISLKYSLDVVLDGGKRDKYLLEVTIQNQYLKKAILGNYNVTIFMRSLLTDREVALACIDSVLEEMATRIASEELDKSA